MRSAQSPNGDGRGSQNASAIQTIEVGTDAHKASLEGDLRHLDESEQRSDLNVTKLQRASTVSPQLKDLIQPRLTSNASTEILPPVLKENASEQII